MFRYRVGSVFGRDVQNIPNQIRSERIAELSDPIFIGHHESWHTFLLCSLAFTVHDLSPFYWTSWFGPTLFPCSLVINSSSESDFQTPSHNTGPTLYLTSFYMYILPFDLGYTLKTQRSFALFLLVWNGTQTMKRHSQLPMKWSTFSCPTEMHFDFQAGSSSYLLSGQNFPSKS